MKDQDLHNITKLYKKNLNQFIQYHKALRYLDDLMPYELDFLSVRA